MTSDQPDVRAATDALASCTAPRLIGIRHHSAALSRQMPALLDALRPRRLFIELPSDLDPWIPWLAHPQAQAPLALAAATSDGAALCFLPFADFSPELAAMRWALQHRIPVHGIDLPCDRRHGLAERENESTSAGGNLHERMQQRCGVEDSSAMWDRLVEVPALLNEPEALRRAALAIGWAWRQDAPPGQRDLVREAWMRQRIADLGGAGAVAVIGSFHAAALLSDVMGDTVVPAPGPPAVTALIPYTFAQFDERSGYGAGIRDPAWQQLAWSAADPEALDRALVDRVVAVCRRMRANGHLASAADATELVRLARDLARIRGLPAPGRAELVEAAQSVLARGELHGPGRAVAAALEAELVGHRRGNLPADCPRSGLAPAIEALLAGLTLPGPTEHGDEPRELRLDPLRSDLDRLRVVVFERLALLGIPYAERVGSAAAIATGAEHLTQVWKVTWTAATAALIEAAAVRGATLDQAVHGALRAAHAVATPADGEVPPVEILRLSQLAARVGAGAECDRLLGFLGQAEFLDTATLPDLVGALMVIQRLERGHEPGLPAITVHRPGVTLAAWRLPDGVTVSPLVLAAERRLDGLAGSDRREDVLALLDLWAWWSTDGGTAQAPGDGRLRWAMHRLQRDGGPLMQGTATGLLAVMGDRPSATIGIDLGSWIDGAVDAAGRHALRGRLTGVLLAADQLLTADVACLDDAHLRLDALPDAGFIARLPALRIAALELDEASRERLLNALLERHAPGERNMTLIADPLLLIRWATADAHAAQLTAMLCGVPEVLLQPLSQSLLTDHVAITTAAPREPWAIPIVERWRLMLGQPRPDHALATRLATTLETCYGRGSGEGSRRLSGQGVGIGAPQPDVRAWDEDLAALFGGDVRDEVLADRALTTPAALELIDPATATPSVALLERILALKGGLPAAAAPKLRALARRLVDELARQLARRLAPSLAGLGVARPTRRRTNHLDLRATVRANLDTIQHGPHGPELVARRLRYLARARRTMDWHLVLVVDVSGSMEASTIHSALMASVFARLPALSVEFLAFSTEVIDFTARVDDPLELLLEVRVGGGTHIGLGLRRARERLRVPQRSLVVVVSDFEEGVSVGQLLAEVRALKNSGARLLGLAALDAHGQPRYHAGIAAQVAAAGMPVAALSPQHVAKWVAEQLR